MMVEEHGSTKTTTISRRKAGQLQQQTVFYHFSACHQRPRVLASSQMPQMHSTHWSAAERRNYIHTGKLSKLLDHSKHNKLNEIIKYNRRKKKKDKWRTSTLRGWLPFAARKRGHASFGTYHKITETGGSWDSHSFFLFVENFRGLQIFTQHKSRFHHSPLPWVSMSILGIPMGIQCVSWVSFPLPSPHSWRSAPHAPGARRS